MALRKPTLLRWTEEAEAHQVCEWAELERDGLDSALQLRQCVPPPSRSRRLPVLLRRLGTIFGRRNPQIARYDGWLDSLF